MSDFDDRLEDDDFDLIEENLGVKVKRVSIIGVPGEPLGGLCGQLGTLGIFLGSFSLLILRFSYFASVYTR